MPPRRRAVRLSWRRRVQRLSECQAGAQPPFHVATDADKVAQLESEQVRRHIGVVQHDQAVRFLHLRRDFREKGVGGDADRAGEAISGFARDPLFDPLRERNGLVSRREGRRQVAAHLVDRHDLRDMDARLDEFDQAPMVGDILERGSGFHDGQTRTGLPGLGHAHAAFRPG